MSKSNFPENITPEKAYETAQAIAAKQTPRVNGPFAPPEQKQQGMLDHGPTRPDLQQSVYFSAAVDPKTTQNTNNEHTQERALDPQNRPSPHFTPSPSPSATPKLER